MNRYAFCRPSNIALGLGLALLAFSGPASAADEAALIESLRTASERFEDVKVALAEGYIADPSGMCVTAEMEGQPAEKGDMGIHYFRPDLLGITGTSPRVSGTGTHTDFEKPGVLVYEPQADGSMTLVAVENLVFEKGWKEAGNTAPPSFNGHTYATMIDDPSTPADEAHGFEPHYELHAWVFRDNPNGAFEPFNPKVTCKHAPASNHQH
ncbi:MAG TPA: hypothetical protein VGN97_22800 [Mesorhizobium sp.]|jgi:hypothetical protein|nr:hypothetical protein [Mesorhizobium sp.]